MAGEDCLAALPALPAHLPHSELAGPVPLIHFCFHLAEVFFWIYFAL